MKDFIDFYANLPKQHIPLRDLLKDESLFTSIPKNWHIVVTDIEGSSEAVTNGQHNDVNLTATGSIITVLNEIKKIDASLKIPYFFGGDGATFCVPQTILPKIMTALHIYSLHIKRILGLNLRVGSIILEDIYQNNVTVRIAKLRHNQYLTTPVILGNGLKFAEAQIKANFTTTNIPQNIKQTIDLTGMECRWDEISPNDTNDKVICLLISCSDETKQAQVFKSIMDEINYLFGNLEERRPITTLRLKLNTSIDKMKNEMMTKFGKYDRKYLIDNWLITVFGKYYFKFFPEGKRYLYRVTQLSDTIMLDGSINTVLSGSIRNISKLQIFLDSLESQKKIMYGMHITHSSIMSCYVQDRKKNHIHFVDGAEGGYTQAAVVYKSKQNEIH